MDKYKQKIITKLYLFKQEMNVRNHANIESRRSAFNNQPRQGQN